MTRKVLSGLLVGMGMLALSTTAAQASGGGSPSPLTSFFVCNSINGDDSGLVVDIGGPPAIGPSRTGVRVGNATLACGFAKLFRPKSSCTIDTDCQQGEACVNPTQAPGAGKCAIQPNPSTTDQQWKCYSVNASPRNSGSPPPTYSTTDPLLVGTDTNVQDSGIAFVCAPSSITSP